MNFKDFKPLFCQWNCLLILEPSACFLLMKTHVITLESIDVKKLIYCCLTEYNYLLF